MEPIDNYDVHKAILFSFHFRITLLRCHRPPPPPLQYEDLLTVDWRREDQL